MPYLELFERAADHVRRQGVSVTFTRGRPLSASAIERARSKALIPIPASMAEFYAEMGDGMAFSWTAKGSLAPYANHECPTLADVTLESLDKVKWRTEWKDDYDFRATRDAALARQTALRMRRWMPFDNLGNGDRFCLDTAIDPAPVVFDQHDWYDGGTGNNGHVLARSLLEFYTGWAQVCFQWPRSPWWPGVFNPSGSGINWSSPEFQEPFRLSAGGD